MVQSLADGWTGDCEEDSEETGAGNSKVTQLIHGTKDHPSPV